jgi:hypothetical protein
MKDLYTYEGGKKRNVQQAVDEFLDNEIGTFKSKIDVTQASEKAIGTMGFKVISDDVQVVNALERDINKVVPMLLVCVAKLDGKYYGAYYYPKRKKRYAEEIRLDFTLNVVESLLIENEQEWLVVSNFFNLNNVFEKARIMDWYIRYRDDQAEDLKETIKKMQWFQKAQKHQAQKGKKEYTPEEVISMIPTASQVTRMKNRIITPNRKFRIPKN